MAIAFYDISVATYLQVLASLQGVLAKGAAHAEESGLDLEQVVGTRLYPDMFPFRFQVLSVIHHSLGTIRAIESGTFGPPSGPQDQNYADLQTMVDETHAELAALSAETIDALADNDVSFKLGDFELPFTATNFVLSFSHPNLYFHATTAYDILRMQGVPVGKRDFIGQPRLKA